MSPRVLCISLCSGVGKERGGSSVASSLQGSSGAAGHKGSFFPSSPSFPLLALLKFLLLLTLLFVSLVVTSGFTTGVVIVLSTEWGLLRGVGVDKAGS